MGKIPYLRQPFRLRLTDWKNTRIFESDDGEERFALTIIGAGRTIMGVPTTIQRDRAFEDDLLVFWAFWVSDKSGNVDNLMGPARRRLATCACS